MNRIRLIYILSRLFLSLVLMCLPFFLCRLAGFVLLEICISFSIIIAISNKCHKILALSAQFIISLIICLVVFCFRSNGQTFETYEETIIETDAQY